MKVTFRFTKLVRFIWLKLKEVFAPDATETGVNPGVALTPPEAVFTQVTPQVMSKVSVGLLAAEPIIRTTKLALVASGLVTTAVQL